MNLSEHFTLAEMTRSDTAVRLGIDNTAPDRVVENLKRTAALGESIRAILAEEAGQEIPIIVTSGYRCEALERIWCQKDYVGWCDRRMLPINDNTWHAYFATKAHPDGRAMDFHADKFGDPYHIVHILMRHQELMAEVDQLILEGVTVTTEGWVHVNWSAAPRHMIRTAMFEADGTPHYVNGLT